MRFNTIIDWNTCSDAQQRELLMRPAISASESISRTVAEILIASKRVAMTRCVNTVQSLIKPKLTRYRSPGRKSRRRKAASVTTSNRRWPSR